MLLNGELCKSYKDKLFPKTAKKIFGLFDLCLTSNLEQKIFGKLNCKKVYCYGNIKLINEIDKNQIHNVNSDVLIHKDFGLLQAFMMMKKSSVQTL